MRYLREKKDEIFEEIFFERKNCCDQKTYSELTNGFFFCFFFVHHETSRMKFQTMSAVKLFSVVKFKKEKCAISVA